MGGRSSKARFKAEELKRLNEKYKYPRDELADLFDAYTTRMVQESGRKDGITLEVFHKYFLSSLGDSVTPFVEKIFHMAAPSRTSGGGNSGYLLLEDIVAFLATCVVGTLDERIEYVFTLYSGGLRSDDSNEYLTLSNLEEVIAGMFDSPELRLTDREVASNVKNIFSWIKNDGTSITFDDYRRFALANEKIGATLGGIFWSVRLHNQNA